MEVELKQVSSISTKELASALAKSTPKEFADFWFAFNEACNDCGVSMDGDKMEAWAEAMSKDLGANRKRPLKAIFKMMEYLEIKNTKD